MKTPLESYTQFSVARVLPKDTFPRAGLGFQLNLRLDARAAETWRHVLDEYGIDPEGDWIPRYCFEWDAKRPESQRLLRARIAERIGGLMRSYGFKRQGAKWKRELKPGGAVASDVTILQLDLAGRDLPALEPSIYRDVQYDEETVGSVPHEWEDGENTVRLGGFPVADIGLPWMTPERHLPETDAALPRGLTRERLARRHWVDPPRPYYWWMIAARDSAKTSFEEIADDIAHVLRPDGRFSALLTADSPALPDKLGLLRPAWSNRPEL